MANGGFDIANSPVKLAISALVGALVAIVAFTWSTSDAWTQVKQKTNDNSDRIEKLEKRDDQREQDYIALRESIVTLQVQMRNLTDAVQTVGRDVKDIRTAVR